MKAKQPLITIIIATLNCADTIKRCLESIVFQTYPYKELIVMDGDSTDGTVEILKRNDNNITYWESKPDRGIYHAWNKALTHARGEWICFMGADDYLWNDCVLTELLPYLHHAYESVIRVVYGKIARIDENEKIHAYWGKPWARIRWQMPHGMPLGLPHTGMMHHRSLFKNHGFFDETFHIAGDYEFLLRELKDRNNQALFVGELITIAQQIGGLADSNSLYFHREVLRARKKNGLNRLSWIWLAVHVRSFLRERWRLLNSRIERKSIDKA